MEQSDAQIVARVLDGEVQAFRTLVERYRGRSHRYATRLLGDPHDADDVVQAAFVRAYQGLARYRDDGHFDRWLFRILVNCCRTYLDGETRERMRRDRLGRNGDARAHAAATRSDPHLRERLRDALDSLSPKLREAFLLHHLEEMSYPDMADATGVSVSALKMRVHRARELLRETLEIDDD